MRVQFKHGVVANLSLDMALSVGWIRARWEAYGMGAFVVTSAKDGVHAVGSQHRQDRPADIPADAVDIRTWKHWGAAEGKHSPKLVAFAQLLQKEGFRIVVHPDWLPGTPHLHVGLGSISIVERLDP